MRSFKTDPLLMLALVVGVGAVISSAVQAQEFQPGQSWHDRNMPGLSLSADSRFDKRRYSLSWRPVVDYSDTSQDVAAQPAMKIPAEPGLYFSLRRRW